MAKSMALIGNGTVSNILWCSDAQPQTDTLIDLADRPVGIGDTWDGVDFWRDGVRILTPLEEAQQRLAELEAANAALTTQMAENEAAYQEGVTSA